MDLAHFRRIDNEIMKKDTYVVIEQAPFIILDIKSAVCMTKSGKNTKHTIHIARIMHDVRNGKE